MKIHERNSPADPIMSEEGRGGGASGAGTDSPATCGEVCGEAAVPLQPVEVETLYSGSTEKRDLQSQCRVIETNAVFSSSCTTQISDCKKLFSPPLFSCLC